MNKNEIRGYIFMGFALFCFATWGLGDLSSGYICPSDILIVFPILGAVFACIALILFVKAYEENKITHKLPTEHSPAVNRIGRAWIEFDLFQLKPEKVKVTSSEDGELLWCDVHIQAHNWLSQLKSDGNAFRFKVNAIGELGREKVELLSINENAFTVEAGAHMLYVYRLTVPKECDRVALHFTAQTDGIDVVYEQEYEFYPKHYIR